MEGNNKSPKNGSCTRTGEEMSIRTLLGFILAIAWIVVLTVIAVLCLRQNHQLRFELERLSHGGHGGRSARTTDTDSIERIILQRNGPTRTQFANLEARIELLEKELKRRSIEVGRISIFPLYSFIQLSQGSLLFARNLLLVADIIKHRPKYQDAEMHWALQKSVFSIP